jgi:DNA (cytosine-5)-methyltransferase 1
MRVVDLFSGAGGFSEGARMAGAEVIWAANHWADAVRWHSANHPDADHICQDLALYASCEIPDHDLLLASPSCKGFSPARGKHQTHHDKHRATAWIVNDVVEAKRPPFVLVENVPEMLKWIQYPAWKLGLELLGYSVAEHIIDAADCGVPQNRVRLFITAVRGKTPLQLKIEKQPHNAINNCLDWDSGRWSRIYKKKRAARTIARIEKAVADGLGDQFLIPYYGASKTGRSTERPIGTLTTVDRYALVKVKEQKMRMLSIPEARKAMGFRDDYQLPDNKKTAMMLLGNAVCPPVAEQLVEQLLKRA